MVAEESAAKKTAASKKATGSGDRAAAAKKVPGKKASADKSTAKKVPAKKASAKKAGAKKTPAKKAPAKKAAAKRTAGERAAAGTAAAEVTAAEAAADRPEGAAQAPAGQAAQTTTGAGTVAAKKTPAMTEAEAVPLARNGEGAAAPGELPVRPDEDPWTPEEVEEARSGLRDEAERLRQEIISADEALTGLMRDSGDGAGDDDADTGTKNITREHEMALAANAREMLYQSERALERLDAGTYGSCENCGKPIGKARMQAFPRATLCVECKQKQERR
ncbi:TraR/DksA family transcriptional regulator [Streptomyces spirodelae]|uniref:TraR/DksA C4-type zinc finger protein n=1 Tax=Streptomyces spirodelae TaxID=2812904 RepID=A0ABS3WSI7_9ACTN|nr:TraR/DksA C4-type zinc finger protein [Streptomyces spirodelae]MBO8186091.1 TraR/DksA C4-type zinc finger protein [Streptomyces spirodelae]